MYLHQLNVSVWQTGTVDAVLQGVDCITNFVIIPNPTQNGQPVLVDRFCGNGFVTTVCK